MDNVINITQTKDNTIEFDVKIDGLPAGDVKVLLIMHLEKFCLSFKCEPSEDGKWRCTIPPLPFIERTAYKFNIAVIADGYYFEPFKGTLNVVNTAEIYVSIDKTPFGPAKEAESSKKKDDERSPKALGQGMMDIVDKILGSDLPKQQKKEDKPEEKKDEKPEDKKEEKRLSLLKDIIPRKEKKEDENKDDKPLKESNLDSAASSPLNIEDKKVRDILNDLKKKKKATNAKKAPTAVRII
jgi:hypothetical protein